MTKENLAILLNQLESVSEALKISDKLISSNYCVFSTAETNCDLKFEDKKYTLVIGLKKLSEPTKDLDEVISLRSSLIESKVCAGENKSNEVASDLGKLNQLEHGNAPELERKNSISDNKLKTFVTSPIYKSPSSGKAGRTY